MAIDCRPLSTQQASKTDVIKKIAVLYPLFLGGGAESVTLWMLQALIGKYDLTLFTFSYIDFAQLDRQFGTQLDGAGVHLRIPFYSLKYVRNSQGYSLMTIRQHLLAHYFRNIRLEFDLAIAAFNEMDLGCRGIQYIHVPLFGHGNEKARKALRYPTSPIRTLYQRACEILAGYSDERMKQNITLTNSQWTAAIIKKSYSIEAQVLYPPVILDPPNIPWEERENGFTCSGRITHDKNLETVIEIVRKVRELGQDVHLHLLSSSFEPTYRKIILDLRDQYSAWLFVEENLDRNELAHMLARHRYGIHGRANETFGISIAEMVRAGCIPFVPEGGGPEEIVGKNPNLIFHNSEDAVEKIMTVLSDEKLARFLTETVKERALLFSVDRFKAELIDLISEMLK